jgi:formamidopyrimidine-DNA glycosylase
MALFSSIQEVLKTALSTGANLANLPDSYLLPHRHAAGTCPRDGSLLMHEKIGGRTSYYCPKHQKIVG